MEYSNQIYESWRPKQFEKYEDLWETLEFYMHDKKSLLDIGIGRAWFEDFLDFKQHGIKRIVGVDVSDEAIGKRKPNIEYHVTDNFVTDEKFDLIICIDAYHLLKNKNLERYANPGGVVVVSLPVRMDGQLKYLAEKATSSGYIGKSELDFYVLVKL
ncbi:MAG: methyltransferase domain-containing protein [DPANN group archaeon]|nr:methyltransferase domain-containing protein [DPANN group archaeon]